MNLLKSFTAISFITIISRIFGFIRDLIFAFMFGASMSTDAFLVAFKFPNVLRKIFAEGAFYQTFLPILVEYKYKKTKQATQQFISYMTGLLIVTLILVTLIGVLSARWIILLIAPGFLLKIEQFDLTILLLRITFPYIFFISLSSFASAILHTWNSFYIPACVPIIFNIIIILFLIYVTPYLNIPILAIGFAVLFGGLLQVMFQLPSLKMINMLILPSFNIKHTSLSIFLKNIFPAIIGVSVSQISLIMNTIFASFLTAGSVSWMYYSDRIIELPYGVVGASLGTMLFPILSKTYANSSDKLEYSKLLDWGLRICFILTIPCFFALLILSNKIVVSFFQYGKFTSIDTLMTTQSLIAYSFGLIGMILVKILAYAFYAQHNIKIPVKIAIIIFIITQLMNFALIIPLKHVGLAISISICSSLHAFLLYWQLRKTNIFFPSPGWLLFFLKLILAVFIMSISILGCIVFMNFFSSWYNITMFTRMFQLLVLVIIGVVVYFSILRLLGFKISDYHHKLKHITKEKNITQ